MAFATKENVETRLGRELTTDEEAFVIDALDSAASIIAEAAGKDDDWADALTPVPRILKELSVDMVIRTGQNPDGLDSSTETLGQYSRTDRFPGPGEGSSRSLFLSDEEGQIARRVIYGPGSSSSTQKSILDELPEWTPLEITELGNIADDADEIAVD
jgi:hypothetical protein